jgi:hypothetical protein
VTHPGRVVVIYSKFLKFLSDHYSNVLAEITEISQIIANNSAQFGLPCTPPDYGVSQASQVLELRSGEDYWLLRF